MVKVAIRAGQLARLSNMKKLLRDFALALVAAIIVAYPVEVVRDHVKDGSIWMGWTWHKFWTPNMIGLTKMWAGTTLFILLIQQWRRWKNRSLTKQSQSNQESAEHLMKHDPQDLAP